jgi:hypothetical protein
MSFFDSRMPVMEKELNVFLNCYSLRYNWTEDNYSYCLDRLWKNIREKVSAISEMMLYSKGLRIQITNIFTKEPNTSSSSSSFSSYPDQSSSFRRFPNEDKEEDEDAKRITGSRKKRRILLKQNVDLTLSTTNLEALKPMDTSEIPIWDIEKYDVANIITRIDARISCLDKNMPLLKKRLEILPTSYIMMYDWKSENFGLSIDQLWYCVREREPKITKLLIRKQGLEIHLANLPIVQPLECTKPPSSSSTASTTFTQTATASNDNTTTTITTATVSTTGTSVSGTGGIFAVTDEEENSDQKGRGLKRKRSNSIFFPKIIDVLMGITSNNEEEEENDGDEKEKGGNTQKD